MSNQDSNVNSNLGLVPKKPVGNSTTKEKSNYFLFKTKIRHDPEYYDYSLVDLFYKNNSTSIPIICEWCGHIYEQSPNAHNGKQGQGCPYCRGLKDDNNIESKQYQLDKLYNGKYTLLEYGSTKEESVFYCNEHHKKFKKYFEYMTRLSRGKPKIVCGCPECLKLVPSFKLTDSKEVFDRLEKVWKGKLDFSKSEYKGTNTNILVRCVDHDYWFEGTPHHLYNGFNGCPKCINYKGEIKISEWLDNHNIKYEGQKKFDDLKDKRCLSYDFYIPSKSLLIEYNGIQHYEKTFFNRKRYNQFEVQQYHDKLKKEYAEKNKIDLLIIRYDEDVNEKMNYYFNYKDTIFDL